MICQPGEPCIGTFARGATKACGTRSCTPCVNRCGTSKGESLSRAQRSSTVNRSKPAPFEVLRRASIWGKKPSGQRCRLSGSSPARFEGSEQGLALVTEAKACQLLALSDGGLPAQLSPADMVKPGGSLFQK